MISVFIILLFIYIVIQGGTNAETPWSSLGGNERNTGLSPYDTSHVDGTIKWSYELHDDLIFGEMLIDSKGRIYVSLLRFDEPNEVLIFSQNGNLEHNYTFDTLDSRTVVINDEDTVYFVESYITTDDGYVTSRHENFTAFDLKTGEIEWVYTLKHLISHPSITSQEDIYFVDYNGTLHALKTDGTLRWKYHIQEGMPWRSTPAIDYDRGNIIIGFEGYVVSVNLDGEYKWSNWVGKPAIVPIIDAYGNIYLLSSTEIRSVDSNGNHRWNRTIEISPIPAPALGPDGTIYVAGGEKYNNSYLWAYTSDGDLKWTYDLGFNAYKEHPIESLPIVGADGRIYVGVTGTLIAVNPDGTLAWEREFDESIDAIAIGPSGDLFVTSGNSLYRIGGQIEEKGWLPSIGSFITLSMIASTAVIFYWKKRDKTKR